MAHRTSGRARVPPNASRAFAMRRLCATRVRESLRPVVVNGSRRTTRSRSASGPYARPSCERPCVNFEVTGVLSHDAVHGRVLAIDELARGEGASETGAGAPSHVKSSREGICGRTCFACSAAHLAVRAIARFAFQTLGELVEENRAAVRGLNSVLEIEIVNVRPGQNSVCARATEPRTSDRYRPSSVHRSGHWLAPIKRRPVRR